MKNYVLVIGAASLLANAQAEPFQTSAEAMPYLCTTPQSAVDAYRRNHSSFDAAYDLIENGACQKVSGHTRFRVVTSGKESGRTFSQVEIIDAPKPEKALFIGGILNPPIDPEEQARQVEQAKVPEGCSQPTGGEYRRLERGQNGQLYLKRYMVTNKCVNGEMRSFTKPID